MPCLHRFLNYHSNEFGGLFPDWEVEYLFIGTFNPSWDRPDGNNANYFYDRSKFFWKVLPRFVFANDLIDATAMQKIEFSQHNKIGFTDLISGIENIDEENEEDRKRILSFRDRDLLYFDNNVIYNTHNIINYINNNPSIKKIYFTLLAQNVGSITTNINSIEHHCAGLHNQLNRDISTHRLHTPTGQGLGRGAPMANVLTHRWHEQELSFENGFAPAEFDFN